MNDIKIGIKNKTNLTVQLENKYNVTYYEKSSFLSKLLFKENLYPDIYFHKGFLSSDVIKLIENSKIVVVNSHSVKKQIVSKISNIDISKIYVEYPYIIPKMEYDKKIKQEFKTKFDISKDSKIILFRGNDLSKSGLDVVFDIISRMYKKNFTLLIESNTKQLSSLRLQLERSEISFDYRLLEDYERVDELFIASDIFILPTQSKYFSLDILRAMYYKNAVFVMESNPSSEVIDTFSLIQNAQDRSMSFKVDSLLINKDELKKIQKENYKIAKKYSLSISIEKITTIIDNFFDF